MKGNELGKFTVATEVTDQRVVDLLTCAIEGGSAYWARMELIERATVPLEGVQNTWAMAMVCGGLVLVDDTRLADLDDVTRKPLGRKDCARALELMAREYPKHFADFMSSNEDADTGDVFLQLCLFGKLVYG